MRFLVAITLGTSLALGTACRDGGLTRAEHRARGFTDLQVTAAKTTCTALGTEEKSMERFTCMQYHMHNITTPKRIPTAPKNQLCVYWPSLECADDEPRCEEPRAELDFGNVISTLTMRNMDFRLEVDPPLDDETYYAVLLVDMGMVSQPMRDPLLTPVHMLIGNVMGGVDLSKGDAYYDYLPGVTFSPVEPSLYTFLVYEQPEGRIEFDEPRTPSCTFSTRPFFQVADFERKYGLSAPVAGNFFRAERLPSFALIDEFFAPCENLTKEAFIEAEIPIQPPARSTVAWTGIFSAGLGNVLEDAADLPDFTPPSIYNGGSPDARFALMLVDEATRSFNWLMVNASAPDFDRSSAQELIAYRRPEGGDDKRIVFLLFSHEEIEVDETWAPIGACETEHRSETIDIGEFIRKYKLQLVAGNFFQVKSDSSEGVDCD